MKETLRLGLVFALPTLLLLACAGPEQGLPKEVSNAVEQAFNRDDVEGCAAIFTDDGELLPYQAPPVQGKAAITDFCRDNIAQDIAFDTEEQFSLVRGDIAVAQGTYRVWNVKVGPEEIESGKYLSLWKKVNGQWKLHRHIWNTNAPTAGSTGVKAVEGQ